MIFDEYHFGAWRDTAKELFEGEDDAVAKKEEKLEYAADLAERQRRPRRAVRELRPTSCRSLRGHTSTSPARRSGR